MGPFSLDIQCTTTPVDLGTFFTVCDLFCTLWGRTKPAEGEDQGTIMRIQWICLSLVLTGLAVSSAGCLVVAAGAGAAGTVAYVRGALETEEPYRLEAVYAATREAAQQLKLSVLEGKTEKDALSATIVARDAADKRVTIHLKAQTEQTTKLSIRIGTFGDQTKAHMIYNRIRENLRAATPGTPPPATNPPPAPAPATPPSPGAVPAVPASEAPSVSPPPSTVASPPAPR